MPVALVLGCGECVWADAHRALQIFAPDAVFAVKDMMAKWPCRVDYGATLHPDRTAGYLADRKKLGLNTNFPVWAHRDSFTNPKQLIHRTTSDWQGSTSLFAVKVALCEEGFDGAVLAGVPMDPKQRHVTRHRDWVSANMFKKGWMTHLVEIKDKVRSMSGWTMELLGEPTPEWLKEVGSAPPDQNLVKTLEVANGYVEGSLRKAG